MAHYCYGCMKPLAEGEVCACGYGGKQNYSHQLPAGTVLNQRYLIGKVLGQGGFGITYIGRDQLMESTVAIKEFYPHTLVTRNVRQSLGVSCADESTTEQFRRSRDRFLKEARTLVKLNSVAGIVHVQNVCLENNTAYIIMEYLEGMDLKQHLLKKNAPMTAEETLSFFQPVLFALQKVHEQGLIHRDISPDNIMVLKDGNIKLLDFGAARELNREESGHTFASELVVKQGFAPIEQYREHADLGPAADIYALCASMYYCMTGQVPNNAPDRFMGNDNVNWKQIPGLTREQTAALEKGLAIRAGDRFSSVEQLWEGLYNVPEEPKPEPVKPKKKAPVPPRKQQEKKAAQQEDKQKKGLKSWIPILAAIQAVLLILCVVLLVKRNTAPQSAANHPSLGTAAQATEATEAAEVPIRKEGDGTEGNPYPAVIRTVADGLEVKENNLHVQVKNGRQVTVTLSGLTLKDSYLTNMKDSGKNVYEYRWNLTMRGPETYAVSTSSYAYHPGAEQEKTIAQMEHTLWVCREEDGGEIFHNIGPATMSHTQDSISWVFTVPQEYAFDFSAMQEFVVRIMDKSEGVFEERYYVVETEGSAEPEQEPVWKKNILSDNYALYGEFSRNKVTAVYFLDSLTDAQEDAMDVSEAQDGSVLLWKKKNGKELYIAGEGGVNGAQAAELFFNFTELREISFNGCFFTEDATNMSSMFSGCSKLESVDLSGMNTANVTSMEYMFSGCSKLHTLDLSNLNTSKVEDMKSMFFECGNLQTLDISGLDTSAVRDMSWMFSGCSNLQTLDISGIDTSQVTDMQCMFYGCTKLQTLDVSSFDTSQVTNMGSMFSGCSNLQDLDVGSFDTSEVTYMSSMFEGCSEIKELSVGHFDTRNVMSFSRMFANCYELVKVDATEFYISPATYKDDMFLGCGRLGLEYQMLGEQKDSVS